jgi:hypothetical protein
MSLTLELDKYTNSKSLVLCSSNRDLVQYDMR